MGISRRARMCPAASTPSMAPCRRISMSTISGGISIAFWMASSPEEAIASTKSIHMRLAQRGTPMIHRTWIDNRVSARRPRHAQEHLRRHSAGGAKADAGRAAARAVRLPAGVPYFAVVCRRPHADDDRGGALLLALQRVPHRACLSDGEAQLGARRAGTAPAAGAHDRAASYAAPVAGGPAQDASASLWLVPHPLELRHAGPDAGSQARAQSLGRDDAPLAPRGGLGVEAGQAGGQRRRPAPGGAPGPHPLHL